MARLKFQIRRIWADFIVPDARRKP